MFEPHQRFAPLVSAPPLGAPGQQRDVIFYVWRDDDQGYAGCAVACSDHFEGLELREWNDGGRASSTAPFSCQPPSPIFNT